MNVTIPVNEYKAPEIREHKIQQIIDWYFKNRPNYMIVCPYTLLYYHPTSSTPEQNRIFSSLTNEEVIEICRIFIKAKYHVYRPSSWDSCNAVPYFVTEYPMETFNAKFPAHRMVEEIVDTKKIWF